MHRCGNDFSVGGAKIERLWLGKQKLVKNSQDSQIQSITLCNTDFSKKVYTVYNGVWGKAPVAGECENFYVNNL